MVAVEGEGWPLQPELTGFARPRDKARALVACNSLEGPGSSQELALCIGFIDKEQPSLQMARKAHQTAELQFASSQPAGRIAPAVTGGTHYEPACNDAICFHCCLPFIGPATTEMVHVGSHIGSHCPGKLKQPHFQRCMGIRATLAPVSHRSPENIVKCIQNRKLRMARLETSVRR